MGEGRKKGPGGGGNPLNYTVVGNPQPANPKPNTIWLNTDVKITGHYIQAEQPTEMQPCEVWISTGKASLAAFNILKKGHVIVYPITAKLKQEDGTIVDVTAKTWKDGQWVDWWNNQLYDNGNEFEGVTGGWISEAVNHPSGSGPSEVTITRNSDSLTIKQETNGGGIARTKNKIDLSNISSLVFTGDILGTINNGYAYIYVWSEIGTNFGQNVVASTAIHAINKSDTTITIPVSSLTGSYYIGFALYSVGITVNMKSFIMAE